MHHDQPHYHKDERGVLQRCYHKCRVGVRTWMLAVLFATLAFPIEHGIWHQVGPLHTASEHVESGIGWLADNLGIGNNDTEHE